MGVRNSLTSVTRRVSSKCYVEQRLGRGEERVPLAEEPAWSGRSSPETGKCPAQPLAPEYLLPLLFLFSLH